MLLNKFLITVKISHCAFDFNFLFEETCFLGLLTSKLDEVQNFPSETCQQNISKIKDSGQLIRICLTPSYLCYNIPLQIIPILSINEIFEILSLKMHEIT